MPGGALAPVALRPWMPTAYKLMSYTWNMKLLLTSNGLANNSIKDALEDLVGKHRNEIKIVFIPTAAFCTDETAHEKHDWLAKDINDAKEFCGHFRIVSLADVSKEEMLSSLEYADVIFIGGGNAFYLSYWMDKLGLFDELPRLLESRVYAGISAGTMIATQSLRTVSHAIKNTEFFNQGKFDEFVPGGKANSRTAKLVDLVVRPHYGRRDFDEEYLEDIARDVGYPLYALDDQSALKIIDGKVEVISEGTWKLLK